MIARISIQLLILCAMTIVCIYSKEYILEDLVAMETNNRRNIQNSDSSSSNNGAEIQKITRQRQISSVRQKKADEGNNGADDGGNTNGVDNKKSDSVTNNNSNNNNKDDEDEDKKTLAQQVVDGKYGLIQKEIFPETPKRPGIISYEVNPEVPKDNVNNLGGLKPEEIWLAENHLLVLAGGGKYNDDRDNSPAWPPIDNYRAPPRQVKIPPNPKVPPPFPVQLKPGGPIEFIRGENGSGGPPPQFPPFFPPANFSATGPQPSPFFGPPPGFHPGNFSLGNGPATPFPFPFPPLPPGINNGSIPRLPPPGAFPQGLPPGANFLPPPGNFTGQFDEDDPSIYYPPPYDFVYKRENTTSVPPGPLVPGIVLPPPPDFFASLEDEKQPKPKRPVQKYKRPQQVLTPYRGKPEFRYPTTTKRPAVQIVTDEPAQLSHLNEVTPETLEHVLPPNAEVQGWVPIPAPRPFYITGPRKTLVKNPDLENIRNGYQYDTPNSGVTEISNGLNFIDNRSQSVLLNDQSDHRGEGKVLFHPTTTFSPVPYQSTPAPKAPVPTRGKGVKSFYFYDEPPRLVSTQPPIPIEPIYTTSRPQEQNLQYYTTTVRPPPRPFQAEQPASPAPIQYFYITKRPQPIESTTSKPPIYEYSYTAPGYGSVEAPKLTGVSTPAPAVHQVPPVPQYDINNYYQLYNSPQSSTRPPVSLTYSTTIAPPTVHSTTIRPETYHHTPKYTSKTTTPSPYIVQTENPYAYFTHHDYSLIDDITKKYFTIFGQKINSGDGATTPLSPVVGEVTTKSTVHKQKSRVKFPVEQQQQQQTPVPPTGPNDYTYYWSSPRPPSASGPGQNIYSQYPSDYDYYDDVNYNYGQIDYRYKNLQDLYNLNGGRPSAALVQQHQQQQQQPSYEGDTRVNFVQPLPPRDPDAEEFSVVPLKNRQPISGNYVGRTRINSAQAASLQDDTKVNYINPPSTPDPAAEIIDPSKLKSRYQQYSNSYVGRLQNNVVTIRPPSFQDDTNVNYVSPPPTPDPNAEVFDTSKLTRPRYQQYFNAYAGRLQNNPASLRPPSLQDDTRVNYVTPLPLQDPNAEVFDPSQLKLGYRNRGTSPSNLYLFGRYQQQQQQQQQPAQLVGLAPSQRPPTLEGDTNVNYLNPRPPINPDAEVFNPKTRQQIITNLFNEFVGRAQTTAGSQNPPSLLHDTRVNENLQGQDPDAIVFDPKNPPKPDFGGRRGHSDIIAYRLPGNGGGHFYFLTPQNAAQQSDVNYQSQDSLQQNLFRRNVRRQSSSVQDTVEQEKQGSENRRQIRRNSRAEDRRRSSTNRNSNSSNNYSNNNNNNIYNNNNNNNNDHTT